MATDTIHPVVELLAARMESHPEEFEFFPKNNAILGRWSEWIHRLTPVMNDAEKELLLGKSRQDVLQVIHEEVLEELVAGPKETIRYDTANRYNLQQTMIQQQIAAAQQNAITQSNLSYGNTLHVGGDIMMGTQRLNEGILGQIKNALGIR